MKKIIFLSLMNFLFSGDSESTNIPNNQPANNQERRIVLHQLSQNPQKSTDATNSDSYNELFEQLKANLDNVSDPYSVFLKASRSLIEKLLSDPRRFSLPSLYSPKMIDNELHHEALDALIRLDYLYGNYLYARFLIGKHKERGKAEAAVKQKLDIHDFLPTLFPTPDQTLTLQQEQTFLAFWKLVTGKSDLIAYKNMAHILMDNQWLAKLIYYGGTPLSHWLIVYNMNACDLFTNYCGVNLRDKDRNGKALVDLAIEFTNCFLVEYWSEFLSNFGDPKYVTKAEEMLFQNDYEFQDEAGWFVDNPSLINFYNAIINGRIYRLKKWWSIIRENVEAYQTDYSLGYPVNEEELVRLCNVNVMIGQGRSDILWRSLYQAGVDPFFLAHLMGLCNVAIVNRTQRDLSVTYKNVLDVVINDYHTLKYLEINDEAREQSLLEFVQKLVKHLIFAPSTYSIYLALSFCSEEAFNLLVINVTDNQGNLPLYWIYTNHKTWDCFNSIRMEENAAKHMTLRDALNCLKNSRNDPNSYAGTIPLFKRLVLRKTAENIAKIESYNTFKFFCDQNFNKLIRDQKRNLSTDILEDLSSTLRYHKAIMVVLHLQKKLDYLEELKSKVEEELSEPYSEEEEVTPNQNQHQ